ncbi:hypothetical protein BZK31_02615 [Pseudomonas floridensis]|uniref:Uncharacterized protein n=2 Tax=Pseudomonas TaxID=286 RepID=A0A1X0NB62_9PSED|nr:hypothetical protein DA456_15350 [Pseudomonas syringae pv. atrofaciens]MCF5166160.1 hypothetical protein [Pseudomonas congelans]MCF9019287.1 hypothetical protein [Pseudomonas syringae]ORC61486.1 hypothetical protein BZK31_02615 [Pseudomonas floridensis]QGL58578.1 hypothetical protein POR16_20645 [Pseudomonas coronafaciens pv. oryzae str. 1_6]TVT87491.1 hypothetical protein FPT15_28185 [Pseudomonas sp. RGB]
MLRNGTVDGRSLPDVLYALAAWKAKRWKTAKAPFYMPTPVQPAMWKVIIHGQRCTTSSAVRVGELPLRPRSLQLILHFIGG